MATRMGFEPTRAEHIGLAVQRLNHSATSSCQSNALMQVNSASGNVDTKETLFFLL